MDEWGDNVEVYFFVCSCQAGRKSWKIRPAKYFSLRREHTIGREGVLARVETKVALKRAPAVFPK